MPQADTGVAIDSTAEDITDVQAIEAPDPSVDSTINNLAATESELDAALAGG
jgi:hypothetical protein